MIRNIPSNLYLWKNNGNGRRCRQQNVRKYNVFNNPSILEVYKGDFKNFKHDGQGILINYIHWDYWREADKYIGEFKNNMKHGKGVFNGGDMGRCSGEWKDDIFIKGDVEKMRVTFLGEDVFYTGEYKNGEMHGYGEISHPSYFSAAKLTYEGEWENGKRHGRGKCTIRDNKFITTIQDGEWLNDTFIGEICIPLLK